MTDPLPWWRRPLALSIGLGVVLFMLYRGVLEHAITLDSHYFLVVDARVSSDAYAKIFTTDYWNLPEEAVVTSRRPDLYRPLTLAWMALLTSQEGLASGDVGLLNAGNLLLHLVGVVLRFLIFRRLLGSGRDLLALLGAFVVGVHPVSSEVVATQVGASEGLVMVLGMASLWAYLKTQDGNSLQRRCAWALHVLAVFLAMLAKEHAVVLVGGVYLLAWLPEGRGPFAGLLRALPAAGSVALALGIRWAVLGRPFGEAADPTLEGFPPGARLATALAVIWEYDLAALVFPARLHPLLNLGDLAPAEGLGDPRALGGLALVIVFLVAFAWSVKKRATRTAWALGFAGGALLLSSNLLLPIGALGASRFLYLPMTGLGLLVAEAGLVATRSRAPWRTMALASICVAACVIPTSLLATELRSWRNNESLYEALCERYPNSLVGNYQLGAVRIERLAKSGTKSPNALDAAIACFAKAASTPRPWVPGSENRPIEDLLDQAYQACMNAGAAHFQRAQFLGGALGAPEVRSALESGEHFLLEAAKVTEEGLRLGTSARTDWKSLAAEVRFRHARVLVSRWPGASDAQQREWEPRLSKSLRATERLVPTDPRIAMTRLLMDGVRGQDVLGAWADLYRRVVPALGSSVASREVAREYVGYLRSLRRVEPAVLVMIELFETGGDAQDAQSLLAAGRELVKPGSPWQPLGRRALEAFIRGDPTRFSKERALAARILRGIP